MPRPAKYAAASRARGHAITHWVRKTDAIRQAIKDGWSTDWISCAFNIPATVVRELSRQM